MSTLIAAPDRLARQVRPSFFHFQLTGSGESKLSTTDEDGNYIADKLQLTQAEFAQLGNGVLNTWQNEVGFRTLPDNPLQRQVDQGDRGAEQRVTFAAAGSYAFQELVDATSGGPRGRLLAAVEALQSEEHRPIVFMSDAAFPWRLLYATPGALSRAVDDDTNPAAVPLEGFLGLSGVVDHQLPISDTPGAGPGRRVSVGVYERFRAGAGGLADIAAALQAEPPLVVEFADDERELARSIAKDGSPLVYLFCHGRFRDAQAGAPVQELVLKADRALTGNELVRRLRSALGGDGRFATAPITVVNACQGGVFGGPNDADTVIDTMRKHGAQGTLAPLVDMPVVFGAQFGVSLLRRLVRGTPLGDALLETSRAYAVEKHNLLGLAYATVNGRVARLTTQEGAP